MLNWIGYLVAGKIVIYLAQKFPLPAFLSRSKFIKDLHGCDLCFGVWVYFFGALLFRVDIMRAFGFSIYFPFLNEALTGGLISYLVHIFFIGLRAKYEVIIL